MAPHPIAQQAAHIAVELRQLQKRIAEETESNPHVVEDRATLDLIRELKSAVDAMRLLLWKYIDKQATERATLANSERLMAATEALKALRSDRTTQADTGSSFIESISSMVERYRPNKAA